MKILSVCVIASALLVLVTGDAEAYWRRRGPFYDAAYLSAVQGLGYRGARYVPGSPPAYGFGDPAYGGCRRGHELVPTPWGVRHATVRLCPAGSGPRGSHYRPPRYYY
jgi:hypothetical protein